MRKSVRWLNGYLVIYKPKHPKAMRGGNWDGFVYEHIYIAEKHLGRSLRKDEVVHHLDFNRGNNHPKNLIVLPSSSHRKLHAWISAGARIGNKDRIESSPVVRGEKRYVKIVNRCVRCARTLESEGTRYCSNSCRGKSTRKKVSRKTFQVFFNKGYPWVKIGELLGISDNGARKIAKRLGFDIRTRTLNAGASCQSLRSP